MLLRFNLCSSWEFWNTQYHSKPMDPLAYTIYPPCLLQCSLGHEYQGILQIYPMTLGSTTKYFKWLWFSLMVSVCCYEKFLYKFTRLYLVLYIYNYTCIHVIPISERRDMNLKESGQSYMSGMEEEKEGKMF